MIDRVFNLLIEEHDLLVLVTLTKGSCLDEIGKETSLCHLVDQSCALSGLFLHSELLEVKEVSSIKKDVFAGVRCVLANEVRERE